MKNVMLIGALLASSLIYSQKGITQEQLVNEVEDFVSVMLDFKGVQTGKWHPSAQAAWFNYGQLKKASDKAWLLDENGKIVRFVGKAQLFNFMYKNGFEYFETIVENVTTMTSNDSKTYFLFRKAQ